ncbi:bifunctional indole-3-glycerol-phosphate synthase TrpC/phosphoribosylanthranilate isomerase TrpF [Xenorhabdus nematophila]|uniref:Multifunctional fusion protein n=1 Tax=Xenorhabdus nematophila (strain ATCC 19061 / DSM 3370 / CCUG 14189 / LMG 1036 / NCIMB 9965 / AN6) TaxID=406817 RepID=D3VGQ9_XENNA|nr:bifunctional indole-3-glycerol-phosphate synthase TrpC/phosphoribosylanthranilate isomerase TrpF [Xenorhabdus nematophila]CEE90026.1 bifunctional: indole-3-glycerolphosphate synthetase (N-terminal); N-(5-phosphoribosyl)anthranilate isomerase (C-terminal) [Xenorhabdus nematophila str. Anatoliense]CEF32870.1 bifunctional: indole-3-glycerolphosphate synthetase (N-terminal); N-(5-phosphoribosyl)anthranilate isomerase (C-terminal) [Xenorhabdus nematophila str. Websteri]AYA40138.1 bifunctional indo
MKTSVLQKIIDDKAVYLATRKAEQPLESFIDSVVPSHRRFYQALTHKQTVFILECKKASPSKGLIREDFDPVRIAKTYQPYAAAISVLTDEKYFQGSYDFLKIVSNAVHQPVLCKDFIIDPYQIYLARYYQADAILLMLSVLDDETYREFSALAHTLNMGVLTEVSNEEEQQRAIALGAKVIGINNRDLRDLSIDLERTRKLAVGLPEGTIIISESGIHQHRQVRELSQFAHGFLIGSALMAQHNLDLALRRLIFGDNKICGLTRPQDAKMALQAGAVYGGLIFAEKSPRKINLQKAQQIINEASLQYVGVFQNQSINFISHLARTLSLSAVQLHGQEDAHYINALRSVLPEYCEIWKAIDMSKSADFSEITHVDHLLLDNGSGGTGSPFNWGLIDPRLQHNSILAGGLNRENCQQAATFGCYGLDFNSGVEISPGIKSSQKIRQVFQQLRCYH